MESRADQIAREHRNLRRFQAEADAVSRLIIDTDLPWPDVAIRIERLRTEAERLFPQKMRLFEMIYVRRFHRLWRQWRREEPEEDDE